MSGHRGSRGFTLLEVAVALAILGVGIVTCLHIFSGSLRLESRAARETRAVLLARGAMDALQCDRDLQNRPSDKDFAGGYHLHTDVDDFTPPDVTDHADQNSGLSWKRRSLKAVVTWQDGVGRKTYSLAGIRVTPDD